MPKNKRRSWRKADIKDVEDALEDERMMNKLKRKAPKGKKAAAGGDDDEEGEDLFTVDTAGSSEGLSRAARRELARAKLFPAKAPRLGLSASEEAKVDRRERGAHKRPRATEPDVFDLWSAPPAAKANCSDDEDEDEEEAKASTVIRAPKKLPGSAPKTLNKKVSAAPAVLPAHEGQSMNPADNAFEDLACLAAARQLEKEQEAEALDRKLRPLSHQLRDAHGAEDLKDLDDEAKVKMYRDMVCSGGGGGGDDAGEAGASGTKRGLAWEKSQAKRNKEKKRRVMDSQQAQKKAQKKLEKSVGEVGAILKEMKEREELLANRKKYKQQMRDQRQHLEKTQGVVPRTRRLGRTRFAEEAIVVPDIASASKGLRSMPLKGATAVRERMSSIVRRGLVTAPPEASRSEAIRHKKKANKLQKSRKFISPLMRDNLLLR